jgi:hypothetical protein
MFKTTSTKHHPLAAEFFESLESSIVCVLFSVEEAVLCLFVCFVLGSVVLFFYEKFFFWGIQKSVDA